MGEYKFRGIYGILALWVGLLLEEFEEARIQEVAGGPPSRPTRLGKPMFLVAKSLGKQLGSVRATQTVYISSHLFSRVSVRHLNSGGPQVSVPLNLPSYRTPIQDHLRKAVSESAPGFERT